MASKMYPFINYRDSIHYRNNCSATIVIVKFLLSLSTSSDLQEQSPIMTRSCTGVELRPPL